MFNARYITGWCIIYIKNDRLPSHSSIGNVPFSKFASPFLLFTILYKKYPDINKKIHGSKEKKSVE